MVGPNPLIKPYLKWAGGKRQLLSTLKKHIPPTIQTYYEPFLGGGALFFALQPSKAVINDCNIELITTYKVVRDHVDELIHCLNIHKENNSETYFYQIRELDRNTRKFKKLTEIEKAARLIFLNKTCFNGLYRVNSQGLFNVPYGRYKNPTIYEEDVLRAVSNYLQSPAITILHGDFAEAVDQADKHSFIYFDPPYHSPDKTNFTGYQAGGFNELEQKRLRDLYDKLTQKGVKCMLSNADTSFIRQLYTGFTIENVAAVRTINSDAEGRGKIQEVLIKNW